MTATKSDKFFAIGVMLTILGIALSLALFSKATFAIIPIMLGMAIMLWSRGHLHQYGFTLDPEARIIPVDGEFCAYCGKSHSSRAGAKFCPFCGKDL